MSPKGPVRLGGSRPNLGLLVSLAVLGLAAPACAGHHSSRSRPMGSPPPSPLTPTPAHASAAVTTAERRARVMRALDAYRTRGGFPGAVLAARFGDGTTISVVSGLADREHGTPMPADARMLAGGVGKTFFAALALVLVEERRLDLDRPIAGYLRGAPWLRHLPNADRVTARMLLAHTSGYGNYTKAFYAALAHDPLRPRDHRELLRSLFDAEPVGQPGTRFAYSDLNYDLLATIEETILRDDAYDEIDRRFLKPLGLRETSPADAPRLAGLVPGYTGPVSPVGNIMAADGALIMNPQFEWGYVSTAGDLARWLGALCRGEVIPRSVWAQVVRDNGVDASAMAPGLRWGLGLAIERTPLGVAYGAPGFFPGYMTRVRWYRDLDLAVAIQVNTSDPNALPGWDEGAVLDDVARTLTRP